MGVWAEAVYGIVEHAGEVVAAELSVHDAKRTKALKHDALMACVHRARCEGVPWRKISFLVCRGRGLPASDATVIVDELRKALSQYRRGRGLTPCPRLVSRTTVVVEALTE